MEDERKSVLEDFLEFNNVLLQKMNEKSFAEILEMLSVNVEFLENIESIVEKEVYSEYEGFLQSYLHFCQKSTEQMILEKNWEVFTEAQKVFVDCIKGMLSDLNKEYRVCSCCGCQTEYNRLSDFFRLAHIRHNAKHYTGETINPEEYDCVKCGAFDRDRLMIQFMKEVGLPYAGKEASVLQIAPSRVIERWIKDECPNVKYDSTDLYMDGVTFKSDIQDMSTVADDTSDFFICSHVLEHVQDDRKAMRELRRILKPDGVGIFWVPIALELEQIDEEWGLSEEENWRRFGQGDHCRRYNRQGLISRLEEEGFFVHPLGKDFFGEKVFRENALVDTSTLYILSKSEDTIQKLMEQQEKKLGLKESEQPLVSVIMSCYNHEKFVGEAIESVINQTYPNIEFLVADDGSGDHSVEVMKKYSKYFTEEHYFEDNYGGRAMFLRERTKGKYIAIINSDDVWEKDKIEKQVKFLERNPDYIACFAWTEYVDEQLNKIPNDIFMKSNRNSYQWMEQFFYKGNCLCHPSILMERDSYIKLIKYNLGAFRQLPDFAAWVRLIQESQIYVYPQVLVRMRRHQSEGEANVSAITVDTQCRHLNENMYLWYNEIKNMDEEFFKRVFGNNFVNPDAVTKEEIACEKYFLLKNQKLATLDVAAMFLLFDIYSNPDIRKCFRDKYNYKKKDIFNSYVDVGVPKYQFMLKALQQENESLKEEVKRLRGL